MKQYIVAFLIALNIGLMGWMLIDTLIKLGSTKTNIDKILNDGPTKQSYSFLNNCRSKQIMLTKLGPVCQIEGVY